MIDSSTSLSSIVFNGKVDENLVSWKSNNTHSSYIAHEALIFLTSDERVIFLVVYLFLFSVTLGGNIAAVIATWQSNHRFLQKTCIITLSISDLITGTVIVLYSFDNFVNPYVTWGLGNFLCHLVPVLKSFGSLSSCIAIVVIAIDRYHNVAKSQKCDPEKWVCILSVIIIWIICAGISYPTYDLFQHGWFYMNYSDEDDPDISVAYVCVSMEKEKLMMYNLCITIVIFLPLITIFCWLYFKIAAIVWKHRKLITNIPKRSETSSSNVMENSTTQTSLNEAASKSSDPHIELMIKKKKIRAERKVRTFKVIVVLVFAFISCRLPYHIFDTLRTVKSLNEHKHWIMRYAFNGISLLSCALNPLLYTFLNQTIKAWKKSFSVVEDFICKICCCCLCSNDEFDEFENGKPFIVGTYEKNTTTSSYSKVSKIRVKERRAPASNIHQSSMK